MYMNNFVIQVDVGNIYPKYIKIYNQNIKYKKLKYINI